MKMAVAAAVCAVLAGCASGTASHVVAPPAAAGQPGSPVPILRQTGAQPDPGTVAGEMDIYGDRFASGSFPGGEQVTVYTFADQAALDADLARNPATDGHATVVIRARLADIGLVAVSGASGWIWSVAPAEVAKRVGGVVYSQ